MLYADMFYDSNNKKRVSLEIEKLLSERAIAFWYMDDDAAKWKNKVKAIRFCTDSFLVDDVLRLIDLLKKRFNIVRWHSLFKVEGSTTTHRRCPRTHPLPKVTPEKKKGGHLQ